MKKLITFVAMIIIVASYAIATTPSELGCEKRGEAWYCPQLSLGYDINAKFSNYFECYSSMGETCINNCAEIIDIGCFTTIELSEDVPFELCETRIINATSVSPNKNCFQEVKEKGKYPALVNQEIIDFAFCSKSSLNGLYVIECPQYFDKVVEFDGVITNDGFIILELKGGVGGLELSVDNMVYITLFIIIIIILLSIFLRGGKKR